MAAGLMAALTDSSTGTHYMPPRNDPQKSLMRPFVQLLRHSRNARFWFCQVAGWLGYSIATFLSITLIDHNVSWPHIGHITLSGLLGILCTWPLRPLYQFTFDYPLTYRILIAALAVVLFSGAWTVLRILVFAWIVGEEAIWSQAHYWYFGSLSVFLSWTVLYYGIRFYELLTLEHKKLLDELALKQEEQYKRSLAESSARDAQLQMLRYQLNPHFIFNTLNAINALVQLGENGKAQDMLQLLSDFLRHSLEQDGIENVTLDRELESLMLYLNIERARFEERLKLEFDIEPAARQAMVPGLILQPLLENAMKYAIAPNEDGGTVRVIARVLHDQLQLEVSDSGPGMDTTEIGQGRGLGLSNTLQRLEAVYDSNYSFDASEGDPCGLTIRLCFPYRPEQVPPGALGRLH
jgi:sensor histidine kinase YesM